MCCQQHRAGRDVLRVEAKIGDKCPICKEAFFDDKQKLIKPTNLFSKEYNSIVHDGCYMPYFRQEGINILFKVRCYSLGDAISVTPVLRELKRIYPRANIDVLTYYQDIFAYNPHIRTILDLNRDIPAAMLAQYMFEVDSFDTDKVGHHSVHSVEFSAYCGLNRSLEKKSWEYEVNYSEEDKQQAFEILRANGVDPEKDSLILFNPHGTEWPTRDWSPVHGKELGAWLLETYPNMKLVSMGGKRTEVVSQNMTNYNHVEGAVDLYGKMTLLQSLALMDQPFSKLMITPDTGTLHLASCARELPIVGIFTLIKPFVRTPFRNGELGYKFISVESDSGCNCTYDGRFLTNDRSFRTCPKLDFLESTFRSNIPRALKYEGLRNYDDSIPWDRENFGKQIQEEAKKYKGESLPCFPTVEKVKLKIQIAMAKWVF